MHDTSLVHDPRAAPISIRIFGRLRRDAGELLRLLLVWQDRARQRHLLRRLDDRLLQDMGLSRADVEHEAVKPFWRV